MYVVDRLIEASRKRAAEILTTDKKRAYRLLRLSNLLTRMLPTTFIKPREPEKKIKLKRSSLWDLFRDN